MELNFTPKASEQKPLFYSDRKWQSFAEKYNGLVNVSDEGMPIIEHKGKMVQSYKLTWANGQTNVWVPVSRNGMNGPFISVEKLNETAESSAVSDNVRA